METGPRLLFLLYEAALFTIAWRLAAALAADRAVSRAWLPLCAVAVKLYVGALLSMLILFLDVQPVAGLRVLCGALVVTAIVVLMTTPQRSDPDATRWTAAETLVAIAIAAVAALCLAGSAYPLREYDSLHNFNWMIRWLVDGRSPYEFAFNYVSFWEAGYIPGIVLGESRYLHAWVSAQALLLYVLALFSVPANPSLACRANNTVQRRSGPMRWFGLLVTLTAFLLIDLPRDAKGDSPPAPRVNAHGDPLPDHAVDRLGSTRFRHDLNPWDIVYSPDGKLLATWIDKPGSIHVWDAETGKSLHRFLQPDGAVYPKIAFTSDSKHFGGYHSVWDLKTGNEVLNLGSDFRAFSEDGPRVASLEFNKVQIWDLANRKKMRDFPGEFRAFSKDGKRLTTLVDKKVVVWDVDSGKELQQFAGKVVNQYAGQIVAISDDKDLRLWDTAAGKEMTRLPTVLDLEVRFPFPRNAFSDDGKKFAGLPMKELLEKATIWDTATGKPVGQLVAPRRRGFLGIALSPDGKTAATVNDAPGMMTSIYVWDAVSGKQLHGKVEGVRAVFSPDGKRIASADGIVIRTWDAATGEEKTPVPGPTGGVLCLSYSADGRSIVAGYDNVDASPFRTWDVASRKVARIRTESAAQPFWVDEQEGCLHSRWQVDLRRTLADTVDAERVHRQDHRTERHPRELRALARRRTRRQERRRTGNAASEQE